MFNLVMEEKCSSNNLIENRFESGNILEKFYSVQFSLNGKGPCYIFKLRNTSLNGPCILVKKDSSVSKQLKEGDVLNMEYNQPGSPASPKPLITKIISKNAHDLCKGYYMVGLSIIDKQDKNL